MRKFMSIVAVLAILFALAVPTFAAAEGSPTVPGTDVKVDSAKDNTTGETVDLVVDTLAPEDEPGPQQLQKAEDLAKEKVGAGYELSEPFEIHVAENGVEDPNAKNVTVVFTYDGEGTLAGVLYDDGNGGWLFAEAKQVGNSNKYEVTFEHFCAAMFVINQPTKAPDTGDKKPATGGETGKTSPQTGFDASAYMTVAMVLVLFAGLCFAKARKVTE